MVAYGSGTDRTGAGVRGKRAAGHPGGFKPGTQKTRKRVLVVDDDEAVCVGMREILKDGGFYAACASNGRDAVEAVMKGSFDLVFMDMIMPGMNGLEAFRKIRKIRPSAKVILFTGYFSDASDVIVQGVREGMIDEFIRKPYFADEILRSARKYA